MDKNNLKLDSSNEWIPGTLSPTKPLAELPLKLIEVRFKNLT